MRPLVYSISFSTFDRASCRSCFASTGPTFGRVAHYLVHMCPIVTNLEVIATKSRCPSSA